MPAWRRLLVDAWYCGAWWLWLLRPLEWLFRVLVASRHMLYRWGLLPRFRPDRPLVVVGSVTVGGSGKTPVVIALVEALQRAGLRPGVVSRGYGATAGHAPRRVTADSTAADCGDEPLLIHRRTGCPCVVAPSRAAAVKALLADAIDLVISDDGLQHYALARDMEIAVLDVQAGTGNGWCLPAGPLREPAARLANVDFVLQRGSDHPVSGFRYRQEGLVNLASGESLPIAPDSLGGPVHAIAGIGQPGQFYESLRTAGIEFVAHRFADHHAYSAADFSGLGDRPIIMTEKDAVKCGGIAGDNAWYVKISAELPEGLERAVIELARS